MLFQAHHEFDGWIHPTPSLYVLLVGVYCAGQQELNQPVPSKNYVLNTLFIIVL